MHIERFGEPTTALGECPVWHDGCLWLMDCRAGLVMALAADGTVRHRFAVPAPAGCFAFQADGRIVVALKESIVLLDPDPAPEPRQPGEPPSLRTLARIDVSHPDVRLNDGCALPDGSFVVGTMHVGRAPGEAPRGGLYRLAPDLRLQRIAPALGVANGPGVHPATGRFHIADSAERVIWSFALGEDGALTDRQVFVRTDALDSGPDGCCFDDDGGLWTALVRVGALARFDTAGRLTDRIPLPLAHPTALCFGGPGRDVIYLTSIRDSGRLRADGPLDGAVLAITGSGFRGPARPVCRLRV